jgi:Fe-S cluster assembly protein SufD
MPVLDQRAGDAVARGEQFVKAWQAREARSQEASAWLRDVRRRAIDRFAEVGLPTTRDEEWRFTPVTPIANTTFVEAEPVHVVPADLAGLSLGTGTLAELVFVNGTFAPGLSCIGTLPAGVEVGSLAQALASRPADVERWLGSVARIDASPFTALNTAAVEDGAFVYIPRHAIVSEPVHLIFYSTVSGAPSASYPRLLFVAEEHSESRLIETYAGPAGQVYFTNSVSEFIAGDRAIVDHVRVQRESTAAFHVASMQLRTGRETVFVSHNLALGGGLVRNDIGAVLGGEGGDTTLNGLYLADGQQLIDNHTTIDHALPHNGSHEVYKGILGGKARGVFNGKIIVRPDAQKTDAKQTNKALILSDDAQINTKPQLEIFADDVKCTHGATVGQLDAEMLFYLRARGLGLDQARALLIRGFAGDVIGRLKFEPLRERIEAALVELMPRAER